MTGPPTVWSRLREAADMLVGVPPYRAYREHMADRHPDAPVLSRAEFFRERQEARYGGKGPGRCC